jgi:hypothetical protein
VRLGLVVLIAMKGSNMPSMNDMQKTVVTARFLDAAGAPVPPPNAPEWATSDPKVVEVETNDEGHLVAEVFPTGAGKATVTAKAGALSASIDFEVVGTAAKLELSAAPPEPK